MLGLLVVTTGNDQGGGKKASCRKAKNGFQGFTTRWRATSSPTVHMSKSPLVPSTMP